MEQPQVRSWPGIFCVMQSDDLSAESTLAGLGDKVVAGLAFMVAQTREDLRVYRATFPGWVADASDRGLLSWCHDRMWAHGTRAFDGVREVTLTDRPPLREITVGLNYRLRVKKHEMDGAISTYLTQGALDFLVQEERQTLDGLHEVRLVAGFRWQPENRTLGNAVISLRDGYRNVIWMHDLDEPDARHLDTVTPILPTHGPRAPAIGLLGDAAADSSREHQ